jgi:protein-disulfide isomerase
MWSTAMASLCGVVMMALPAPAKCALAGVGCQAEAPIKGSRQRARVVALPLLPQSAVAVNPAAPAHIENYKQSGSPNAPVIIEIYADYECPACAAFYTRVFPQLRQSM